MSLSTEQNIVGGRFKLMNKLGAGSFGEIFEVKDLKGQKSYACKAEQVRTKHPQLKQEYEIYQKLQSSEHFVRVYGIIPHGSFHLMIMDKLGESLEMLFNHCQRQFSIKTVSLIAIQLISRIEELHKHGWLHRDIKPDNFLVGEGPTCSAAGGRIYMIDLGLGKEWREGGRHIPRKTGKRLIGTPRYASINTHFGQEQSRRDDLESLGYMLMYFARGQLPWQGLKGNTKEEKYKKIGQTKKNTTLDDLCRNYPHEFRQYLNICRNLGFEEAPNYEHLRSLFRNVLQRYGYNPDDPNDALLDWQCERTRHLPVNQRWPPRPMATPTAIVTATHHSPTQNGIPQQQQPQPQQQQQAIVQAVGHFAPSAAQQMALAAAQYKFLPHTQATRATAGLSILQQQQQPPPPQATAQQTQQVATQQPVTFARQTTQPPPSNQQCNTLRQQQQSMVVAPRRIVPQQQHSPPNPIPTNHTQFPSFYGQQQQQQTAVPTNAAVSPQNATALYVQRSTRDTSQTQQAQQQTHTPQPNGAAQQHMPRHSHSHGHSLHQNTHSPQQLPLLHTTVGHLQQSQQHPGQLGPTQNPAQNLLHMQQQLSQHSQHGQPPPPPAPNQQTQHPQPQQSQQTQQPQQHNNNLCDLQQVQELLNNYRSIEVQRDSFKKENSRLKMERDDLAQERNRCVKYINELRTKHDAIVTDMRSKHELELNEIKKQLAWANSNHAATNSNPNPVSNSKPIMNGSHSNPNPPSNGHINNTNTNHALIPKIGQSNAAGVDDLPTIPHSKSRKRKRFTANTPRKRARKNAK